MINHIKKSSFYLIILLSFVLLAHHKYAVGSETDETGTTKTALQHWRNSESLEQALSREDTTKKALEEYFSNPTTAKKSIPRLIKSHRDALTNFVGQIVIPEIYQNVDFPSHRLQWMALTILNAYGATRGTAFYHQSENQLLNALCSEDLPTFPLGLAKFTLSIVDWTQNPLTRWHHSWVSGWYSAEQYDKNQLLARWNTIAEKLLNAQRSKEAEALWKVLSDQHKFEPSKRRFGQYCCNKLLSSKGIEKLEEYILANALTFASQKIQQQDIVGGKQSRKVLWKLFEVYRSVDKKVTCLNVLAAADPIEENSREITQAYYPQCSSYADNNPSYQKNVLETWKELTEKYDDPVTQLKLCWSKLSSTQRTEKLEDDLLDMACVFAYHQMQHGVVERKQGRSSLWQIFKDYQSVDKKVACLDVLAKADPIAGNFQKIAQACDGINRSEEAQFYYLKVVACAMTHNMHALAIETWEILGNKYGNPEAQWWLCSHFFAHNELLKCLEYCTKVIDNPNSKNKTKAIEMLHQLGGTHEIPEAQVKLSGHYSRSDSEKCVTYGLKAATHFLNQNKDRQALECLQALAMQKPPYAKALLELGKYYWGTNQKRLAREHLQKALKLHSQEAMRLDRIVSIYESDWTHDLKSSSPQKQGILIGLINLLAPSMLSGTRATNDSLSSMLEQYVSVIEDGRPELDYYVYGAYVASLLQNITLASQWIDAAVNHSAFSTLSFWDQHTINLYYVYVIASEFFLGYGEGEEEAKRKYEPKVKLIQTWIQKRMAQGTSRKTNRITTLFGIYDFEFLVQSNAEQIISTMQQQ